MVANIDAGGGAETSNQQTVALYRKHFRNIFMLVILIPTYY